MINGEGSSSLLTRLKIQEDIEERERRRIREKEKKEANLVLLQDLAEWEEKQLGPDVVQQLHSMWEVNNNNNNLYLCSIYVFNILTGPQITRNSVGRPVHQDLVTYIFYK